VSEGLHGVETDSTRDKKGHAEFVSDVAVLFSGAVWSGSLPWQPRRYLAVGFGDHGLREGVDPSGLGAWERLFDDASHVLGADVIDGSVQRAPLSFSH
jgi:hypothetical protein